MDQEPEDTDEEVSIMEMSDQEYLEYYKTLVLFKVINLRGEI